MEFLRFGSSIPGSYWGCCAVDIIQNFNKDPQEKASIQLVNGDGGQATLLPNKNKTPAKLEQVFAGPTYKDIFLTRLRCGTFDARDMPNHAFIVVLTQNQITTVAGRKWLKILKETGFEFLRTISNSVYSGNSAASAPPKEGSGCSVNHVFALFRNVGTGGIYDPYKPPKEWEDLPSPVDYDNGSPEEIWHGQKAIWDNPDFIRPFLFREDLEKDNVPITLAGRRSDYPQESEASRKIKENLNKTKPPSQMEGNPFDIPPEAAAHHYEDPLTTL